MGSPVLFKEYILLREKVIGCSLITKKNAITKPGFTQTEQNIVYEAVRRISPAAP